MTPSAIPSPSSSNPDALVSALPGCVPPGEAPRHAPVTAGEYLRQRFAATYGRA